MKVETRGLTKRYGRVFALRNVSLTFHPGQIVSILGLNGAGKTTLLRCLSGVAAADSGEIRMDGKRFLRADLELRRRFMFLPDFPLLFWDRAVTRNLSMITRLYERDSADGVAKATALLEEFDLLPLAGAPVGTLSRGQIYKVALVSLILVDPEVWFLDEPFASGMDPLGLRSFRRISRDALARGRTIVYSTQLLDAAEKFSDTVCVLNEGSVRAFSTLNEIRTASIDQSSPLEDLFRRLREGVP